METVGGAAIPKLAAEEWRQCLNWVREGRSDAWVENCREDNVRYHKKTFDREF